MYIQILIRILFKSFRYSCNQVRSLFIFYEIVNMLGLVSSSNLNGMLSSAE